jgi:hypothetical protein
MGGFKCKFAYRSQPKTANKLTSHIYEIAGPNDFAQASAQASADIWRRARQAQLSPNLQDFMSGMEDLWRATMKLDKA